MTSTHQVPHERAPRVGTTRIMALNIGKLKERQRLADLAREHEINVMVLSETGAAVRTTAREICIEDPERTSWTVPNVRALERKQTRAWTLSLSPQSNEAEKDRTLTFAKSLGRAPETPNQGKGVLTETLAPFPRDAVWDVRKDKKNSRYIIQGLKVGARDILLTSVYGPSDTDPRKKKSFLEGLAREIRKSRAELAGTRNVPPRQVGLIVIGDFNIAPEPSVDKIRANGLPPPQVNPKDRRNANTLAEFMGGLKLVDVKPPLGSFTFEGSNGTKTRIDLALVSRDIHSSSSLEVLEKDPTTSPDHYPILLEIQNDVPFVPEEEFVRARRTIPRVGKNHGRALRKLMGQYLVSEEVRVKDTADRWRKALNPERKRELTIELHSIFITTLSEKLRETLGTTAERDLDPERDQEQDKITEAMLEIREITKRQEEQTDTIAEIAGEALRGGLNQVEVDKVRSETTWRKARNQAFRCLRKLRRTLRRERITARIKKAVEINKGLLPCRKLFEKASGEGRKPKPISSMRKGEDVTKDKTEMRDEIFPGFYEDLFRCVTEKTVDPANPFPPMGKSRHEPRSGGITQVNTTWHDSMFKRALGELKTGKSPGASGVAPEVLQKLRDPDKELLKDILKYCWEENISPVEWKTSVMILLEKSDKTEDPAEYRPISLLESTYKLFTSMVATKVKEHMERNGMFSDLQFGFRENRTTHQAMTVLLATIEEAKAEGKDLHVLMFDFVKAFDSVEKWALEGALRYYDFPLKIIELVGMLYEDNQAELHTPLGVSTRRIRIGRGVRQGDVLSPVLFVVFINTLLEKIESTGLGFQVKDTTVPCISYADDTTLLARSKEELMGLYEEAFAPWCEYTGMKTVSNRADGTLKTKNVYANSGGEGVITIEGTEIPSLPAEGEGSYFRYLGYHTNIKGDTAEQERICLNGLRADIREISKAQLTVAQKVWVLMGKAIPAITFSMGCLIHSEKAQKEYDKEIRGLMLKITGTSHVTGGTHGTWALHAFYNKDFWGLRSLQDLQVTELSGTFVDQVLNGCSPMVRTLARKAGSGSTNQGQGVLRYRLTELLNKHGMQLIETPGIRSAVVVRRHEDANQVMKMGIDETWMWTDGSLTSDLRAGSGLVWQDTTGQWKTDSFRTRAEQSVIEAEYEALEAALARAPPSRPLRVFVDNREVVGKVNSVESWQDYAHYAHSAPLKRIRKAILYRNAGTVVSWVPAHVGEQEYTETEMKRARIAELAEELGPLHLLVLEGNRRADEAAKEGTEAMTNEVTNPEGSRDFYVAIEGKKATGNCRHAMKEHFDKTHTTASWRSKLHDEWKKFDFTTLEETFRAGPTQTRTQAEELKLFLFRFMHGALRSPLQSQRSEKPLSFDDVRRRMLIPSFQCHRCGGTADTTHIIWGCGHTDNNLQTAADADDCPVKKLLPVGSLLRKDHEVKAKTGVADQGRTNRDVPQPTGPMDAWLRPSRSRVMRGRATRPPNTQQATIGGNFNPLIAGDADTPPRPEEPQGNGKGVAGLPPWNSKEHKKRHKRGIRDGTVVPPQTLEELLITFGWTSPGNVALAESERRRYKEIEGKHNAKRKRFRNDPEWKTWRMEAIGIPTTADMRLLANQTGGQERARSLAGARLRRVLKQAMENYKTFWEEYNALLRAGGTSKSKWRILLRQAVT